MKLTVIGSSSKGNGYVIQDENEALVIEAGVSLSRLMEAVSFNLKKIAGCIVTHEHGDHSKHADMYMRNGVRTFMSKGTSEKIKLNKYSRPMILNSHETVKVGAFSVMPFKVEHDAEEPLGFFIYHSKIGNLLFLTDTYYTEYKFKNLNHVIVEANYCREIIKRRFEQNDIHPVVYFRLFKSHMSIQSTLELLEANDLSSVKNIVLIHLSDNNSDAVSFKKQVEEQTGLPTTIADANVEINLVI
jgi:phosphoribosyl 1,2-cyclic phosphodiesterase